MTQQDDTSHHKELQRTSVKKDAAVIDAAVEVLDNWINPFEESKDLITCILSTATRLESENPAVKFHDKIKRCNLKTFSSLSKTKKSRTGDNTIILQTVRSLFGTIIFIAQSKV